MSLQLFGTADDDEKLYDSSSDGPPQLLLTDSNKLEPSISMGTGATGTMRNKGNRQQLNLWKKIGQLYHQLIG